MFGYNERTKYTPSKMKNKIFFLINIQQISNTYSTYLNTIVPEKITKTNICILKMEI